MRPVQGELYSGAALAGQSVYVGQEVADRNNTTLRIFQSVFSKMKRGELLRLETICSVLVQNESRRIGIFEPGFTH